MLACAAGVWVGTWRALRLLLGLQVERLRTDPYDVARAAVVAFVLPVAGVFVLALLIPAVADWLASRPPPAASVAAAVPVAPAEDDDGCSILVTDREGLLDADEVQVLIPWCKGVAEVPGGGTAEEAVRDGRVRGWMELDAATRLDGAVRLRVTEDVPRLWLWLIDVQVAQLVRREGLEAAGLTDADRQAGKGRVTWMNAKTGEEERNDAADDVLLAQMGLTSGMAAGLVLALASALAATGAPPDATRLSAPPVARWLASMIRGGVIGVFGATGFALWTGCFVAGILAAASVRSNTSVVRLLLELRPVLGPTVVGYGAGVALGGISAAALAPVWQHQRQRRRTTLVALFLAAWAGGAWVSSWLLLESVVQGWHRALPLIGLVVAAVGGVRTEDPLLAVPAVVATSIFVLGWSALALRAEARADVEVGR